jgi:flagellar basal-body rod protein FlgF
MQAKRSTSVRFYAPATIGTVLAICVQNHINRPSEAIGGDLKKCNKGDNTMENTTYVGLSQQLALQRRMDMVANNIANVDTTGFKSGHILFAEHIVRKNNDAPLSMVSDYGNYRDFTGGALQSTENPLDVALEGNGFLAVQDAEGNVQYTRNGSMQKNNLGQLVNSAGLAIVSAGGQPIVIPPDAREVNISEKGVVSTDQGSIGQLKIVRFENPLLIKPVGNNLYETDQDPIIDGKTIVKQGMLEGSNVNAVMEMTEMIEVMRRYESVARLLQKDSEIQSSMIQRLSRV